MYLFKSTEKHLAMLKIPFGAKPRVAKRPFSINRNVNSNKEPTASKRLFTSHRGLGTIKFRQIQAKPLSTLQVEKLSILNPNKPDPDNFDSTTIQPITQPRFPKSDQTLPSVTKILQATMPAASRFILDRWKEAMLKKLGAEGFATYQKDTFERGRLLHSLVADYLMGQGDPVEITNEIVANLWKSIENIIKNDISNVRLVEHVVTHSAMKYRGIVDCVACYKDELCVIDFKTAEKPKKTVESLYDNPLQVSAYCGAINNDETIPRHVIDRNICAGLVIVAYIDGSEASVYYLGRDKMINDYWQNWTTRLIQYSSMQSMPS